MAALAALRVNQTRLFNDSPLCQKSSLPSACWITTCVNGMMNFLWTSPYRSWPTLKMQFRCQWKRRRWRISSAYEIFKKTLNAFYIPFARHVSDRRKLHLFKLFSIKLHPLRVFAHVTKHSRYYTVRQKVITQTRFNYFHAVTFKN